MTGDAKIDKQTVSWGSDNRQLPMSVSLPNRYLEMDGKTGTFIDENMYRKSFRCLFVAKCMAQSVQDCTGFYW